MLDILAIGAHPDDIEIFMGGAMAAFHAQGLKTGILDLTRGEAGTYGSVETRRLELAKATEILSVKSALHWISRTEMFEIRIRHGKKLSK